MQGPTNATLLEYGEGTNVGLHKDLKGHDVGIILCVEPSAQGGAVVMRLPTEEDGSSYSEITLSSFMLLNK